MRKKIYKITGALLIAILLSYNLYTISTNGTVTFNEGGNQVPFPAVPAILSPEFFIALIVYATGIFILIDVYRMLLGEIGVFPSQKKKKKQQKVFAWWSIGILTVLLPVVYLIATALLYFGLLNLYGILSYI